MDEPCIFSVLHIIIGLTFLLKSGNREFLTTRIIVSKRRHGTVKTVWVKNGNFDL
jgi:hypothetical protein